MVIDIMTDKNTSAIILSLNLHCIYKGFSFGEVEQEPILISVLYTKLEEIQNQSRCDK